MIKLAHNLEDLAEGIGKYVGMADGIEQRDYVSGLLSQAFAVADRQFNIVAAAAAKGKNFTHMYEFGTKGIHEGGSLSATAQSSRLWRTVMVGGGGRKLITFDFQQARRPREAIEDWEVGNAPAYDASKLGVNNGEKYKWPRKAQDTEDGRSLSIRVRDARVLFVPVIQGLENPSTKERAKGFGFRKQHINTPGEWQGVHSAGQFNKFFWGYWKTSGAETMEATMITVFNRDIRAFNKALKVSPTKPKLRGNINGVSATNRAKTRKQWELQARGVGRNMGEAGRIA